MSSSLITAFKPYDTWSENSSWLALVELTKDFPPGVEVTTRLYPVDFAEMKERLARGEKLEGLIKQFEQWIRSCDAKLTRNPEFNVILGVTNIQYQDRGITLGLEETRQFKELVEVWRERYKDELKVL